MGKPQSRSGIRGSRPYGTGSSLMEFQRLWGYFPWRNPPDYKDPLWQNPSECGHPTHSGIHGSRPWKLMESHRPRGYIPGQKPSEYLDPYGKNPSEGWGGGGGAPNTERDSRVAAVETTRIPPAAGIHSGAETTGLFGPVREESIRGGGGTQHGAGFTGRGRGITYLVKYRHGSCQGRTHPRGVTQHGAGFAGRGLNTPRVVPW